MDKYKITQNEINENNVKSAADLLKGEPRDNKNIFDRLPELIANKVNGFIDAVISKFADYYNKTETEQKINEKVTELGKGDMAKAVYDTDGDGIVDNAKNAENGVQTYTQSASTLSGSGTNGKFKVTATGTYTAFTIGGVSYAVKAGSETEIELTSGVWYSFILDTGAKTINFKAGGAGLNFKIVGGTTQPTSPKENTIWVETDTAISEWQFSATEPTTRANGTALQNGDVWIQSLNKSDIAFNTLKKNGVIVYPSTAKQWDGTQWIVKNAQIYQNGTWKNLVYYIIQNGKLNVANAGALTKTSENGILTYANDYVEIKAPKSSYANFTTEKAIALSNFNTLYDDVFATIETAASGECLRIEQYGAVLIQLPNGTTPRQIKMVDITTYTEDKTISLCARAWDNGDKGPATIRHYNLWLG